MNRSCKRTRQGIPRYLDGELSAGRRERLDSHFHECDGCREELEAFRSLRQVWKDAPVLISTAAERAAVVAAATPLLGQEAGRPGWLRVRVRWLRPSDLVTVGAVAASIVLGVLLYEGRRTPRFPAGWPRSSTVYTAAEYSARKEGTPVESGVSLRVIGPY